MPRTWVGEIEMYYELRGEGAPLVLIHGLGSSCRDWEYQLPVLAERFKVLCLDLRGHGRSDKPRGPYSIALFARDVARLMDKLRIGPAQICGISMGGSVAFHLGLDHSELVRTLTVVNMGAEVPVRTLAQWRTYLSRYLISRLLGPRRMGQLLAPRLFPKPEQEPMRRLLIERWAQNDQAAYLASIEALRNWSVLDRLGQLDCPTLLIAGDADYTPVAFKQKVIDRLPRGELVVVEDARHALPVEKPERFNEILLEFLSREG